MELGGGKLLYKGRNVCVLTPEIPCKKTKKKSKNSDKRVSKIVFDKRKRKIDQEKKMNLTVKSIRNHQKWSIPFDNVCKSKKYSKIKNKYDYDISQCVKKEDIERFDTYGQMYQGKLGGQTLLNYIHSKHYWSIEESQFKQLMKKMKPLFYGLVQMQKHNIIHNDIKYENVVLDDGEFKYIDFGLAGFSKEKTFFEKRSKQEFDTFRFYQWYPIEYLYYYQTKKDLKRELKELKNFDFRKGFDDIIKVHSIFDRDIEGFMKQLLQEIIDGQRFNKTKLLNSLDVYSLGILIPLSFIKASENNLLLQKNKCIRDFYKLFGEMTELDYHKRLSAEKSYQRFNNLLKKYKI